MAKKIIPSLYIKFEDTELKKQLIKNTIERLKEECNISKLENTYDSLLKLKTLKTLPTLPGIQNALGGGKIVNDNEFVIITTHEGEPVKLEISLHDGKMIITMRYDIDEMEQEKAKKHFTRMTEFFDKEFGKHTVEHSRYNHFDINWKDDGYNISLSYRFSSYLTMESFFGVTNEKNILFSPSLWFNAHLNPAIGYASRIDRAVNRLEACHIPLEMLKSHLMGLNYLYEAFFMLDGKLSVYSKGEYTIIEQKTVDTLTSIPYTKIYAFILSPLSRGEYPPSLILIRMLVNGREAPQWEVQATYNDWIMRKLAEESGVRPIDLMLNSN